MMEPHDYDKLKQEEADEQRERAFDRLYDEIRGAISELNNIIKYDDFVLTKAERAEYVRETLANLIEG